MPSIKIRTKPDGDKTLLRILIEHPMETGRRQDERTGQIIPAHFITELKIEHNGKPVATGLLSTGVSRNPYFSLRLKQAKAGDTIRVGWVDNRGGRDSAEVTVGAETHP
ncbi:MAG: thiosulfate oxidation carrier complex protein SoxZ [Methylococcus sp.]